MKKSEQTLIDESLAESEANIGENKLQTVPTDQSVALPGQFKGMDIEGLEGIPAGMVAIPYCRLIQPTSKKTVLKNGKEAIAGNFMFNDIQEEVGELNFVMLRAKVDQVKVDSDGQYLPNNSEEEGKIKQIIKILGVTTDTDKLFILTLTTTSFSSWGRLMAQFKAIKVDKSYRFNIKAVGEKKENKKGKYYTVNFSLDKELTKEKVEELAKSAQEYGVVLDKQLADED